MAFLIERHGKAMVCSMSSEHTNRAQELLAKQNFYAGKIIKSKKGNKLATDLKCGIVFMSCYFFKAYTPREKTNMLLTHVILCVIVKQGCILICHV